MKEDRGSWYLLTAIVLGIGIGLIYSWIISPIEYIDTSPVSMREDYKDHYRKMIALAYAVTRNLNRAKDRLELLGDENSAVFLVAQAQQSLAADENYEEAQALANLAAVLGQAPTPFPSPSVVSETPPQILTQSPTLTESHSPSSTFTPTSSPAEIFTETPTITMTAIVTTTIPRTLTITETTEPGITVTLIPFLTLTQTPTPTLLPPFVLDNMVEVCNPLLDESQIQVFVSNPAGIGIPGIEIVITWDGGEDHIFTGIKSDIDIGYADFVMVPEESYVLQVADGGQLITDLTAPNCTKDDGEVFWGSLRLVFSYP